MTEKLQSGSLFVPKIEIKRRHSSVLSPPPQNPRSRRRFSGFDFFFNDLMCKQSI